MKIAHFERDYDGRYSSAIKFAQVQAAKRERARRQLYLPSDLFAEPAWDILLELYAFELVSRLVSESELAERIDAPGTTTARWMKLLEAEDLIARRVDPDHFREVRISLTPKGLTALGGYFSDVG